MGLRLDDVSATKDAAAVVLFLHGGQQERREPVKNRHARWWRMAWLAWSLGVVATWQPLDGAGHFMFKRIGAWRSFVVDSVNQIARASTGERCEAV